MAVIKPIKDEHESDAALQRMADKGLITLRTRKGPLPRFAPVMISGPAAVAHDHRRSRDRA